MAPIFATDKDNINTTTQHTHKSEHGCSSWALQETHRTNNSKVNIVCRGWRGLQEAVDEFLGVGAQIHDPGASNTNGLLAGFMRAPSKALPVRKGHLRKTGREGKEMCDLQRH